MICVAWVTIGARVNNGTSNSSSESKFIFSIYLTLKINSSFVSCGVVCFCLWWMINFICSVCISAFTQFAESNKLFTLKKIKWERWNVLIHYKQIHNQHLLTHKHGPDGISNCLVVHCFQHTAFNLTSIYNLYMALYFHKDSKWSSSSEQKKKERIKYKIERIGKELNKATQFSLVTGNDDLNWKIQSAPNAFDTAVNVIVDSAHGSESESVLALYRNLVEWL